MMNLKNYLLCIILLISACFSGCNKYLLVDPKTEIGEYALFETEDGFQYALTGLYAQLAGRKLYGDNLTMGFLSLIGQNYSDVLYPNFSFPQSVNLAYNEGDAKSFISDIWLNAYNTIAGANIILSRIDEKKPLFTAKNYARIKAEVLAIRAYLHFDLLRLFGPNYSDNTTAKAIPYRTEIDGLSQTPATMQEVTNLIISDLEQSHLLFQEYLKNPAYVFNRFRMNIHAVNALKSRVYVYMGDKPNAYQLAKEIVETQFFELIEPDRVSVSPNRRDRTFSSEQIFALRTRNIRDWTENIYFKPVTSTSRILSRSDMDFNILFETNSGGATDIRFANLIEKSGEKNSTFYTKYWQTWTANDDELEKDRLDQNVSLIRLSELYYILAETAPTPTERLGWLNKVRAKRVLPILHNLPDETSFNTELLKEYQKDFYAEGQTFFYYKRTNSPKMLFSNRNLVAKDYIIPVPDNELEFNPNYK